MKEEEKLNKELTGSKNAENELYRRNRELSTLYTIDRVSSQSLNLEVMLCGVLEATLKALGLEAGGIYLSESNGKLKLCMHRGFSEEFAKNVQCIKMGEGMFGSALNKKKPSALNVSTYPTEQLAPFVAQEGFQTFVCLPLISGGELIGAFNMAARSAVAFPPEDVELLLAIGQQLGTSIRNAWLYEKAQRELEERRLAEEAVEIALKNWQNTFNAISDSVFILDTEGHIMQSNGVFENMSGIKTEDMIGQYCYKAIHSTSDFIEGCQFEQMKQTGMCKSIDFEDKERRLWFQVTIDPVYNESDEITNFVHIMRDVTELKKGEETRFENIQLVLANRAKSDFLSHMSHELRTPLNSIIGFSELLVEKTVGELNKKQEHYVDNVLESSKHLLALINDILDLSKVEAGKIELVIEKISVPETISDVVTLIKERAMKHNVIIKKDIDPQLEIEADRQRLKQILFNLLSNAVKFSKPEEGTITITAKKEDGMAKISISDTGIGIMEENIRKLFSEFEQLDKGISRKYEGTGLGLAITKKLVELHGGKIWAESRYGAGSTFTFFLPLKAEKEAL